MPPSIPEQLNAALASRYVIERHIGEGGMATVFLARDVRHDRLVALKVLKPELGAVLGVERFLAEIKVTANLQHPNLLPLFESGEAAGLLFDVMPFVEGESLRVRLDREKQLPIDEVVRLTVAIAGALDYAHRHGVIHRDLKPENILLQDRQPLIADFGIALAVSKAGGARVTQTGLSLGTPQYMSPEQASGDRAIDARSDIYSLAAMTYEMIAGEPPHSGTTAQAIIAKLMTAEPLPLSSLRKSSPVHLEAAVSRALAKLPADRFESARDFADAVEGRGFTLAQAPAHLRGVARPVTTHPAFIATAAVAVIAIGAAIMAWRAPRAAVDDAVVRFQVDLPPTTLTSNSAVGNNVAVSPDGKTITFVSLDQNGITRLYLRAVDEIVPRPLAGTEGAQQPIFSPDGKFIAYLVGSDVFKIPAGGGATVKLGVVVGAPVGLTWTTSGKIVAGSNKGVIVIPEAGGEAKLLAKAQADTGRIFNQPFALPDGDHIMVSIQGQGGVPQSHLGVLSLKSGVVSTFELQGVSPIGYREGHLIYVSGTGALTAVPFDAGALKFTGDPIPLGVTAIVRVSGAADAALSPAGTLVVVAAIADAQIGWVDEHGTFTPIARDARPYVFPRLSPDATRIALTIGSGARSDIWIYDIASGTPTRVTSEGSVSERPEWTPDGKRVLYRTDRGKRTALWWQAADLSGPAEPLVSSDAHDYWEGVITPDGKMVVFQIDDSGSNQADVMWRAISGDTTSHPVAASNFVEAQGRVSPDGKWVALVTDAAGTSQVAIQPFPGPGGRVQVSVAGGSEPVWSRDGKRLFYRDGRKMIAASLAVAGGAIAVTSRVPLFDDLYVFAPAPHANYDIAPDGKRFLMVRNAEMPRLTVVHGWGAELRAKIGPKK